MQARLIVVGGKASRRDVLLKLPSTIGRSRDADLTVAHPMVSRKHCEAYEVGGLLMIRDLGSLNGTYVGGKRVREAPLPPNQEFTVGPLTFRASYEYAGDLDHLPPVVLATEAKTVETTPAQEVAAAAQPASAVEELDEESPAAEAGPGSGSDAIADLALETMFEVDNESIEKPSDAAAASEEPKSDDPDFDAFLEDLK